MTPTPTRRRRVVAALLALPLAATAVLGPAGAAQAATSPAVTVDVTQKRQEIRGFGGMNHPLWIGDLTAAQRDKAFGNGTDQLGFSMLRIFVSEDRTQWQREVATARRAIEQGAIVFASPWNPPASMTETAPVGQPQGTGTLYQAESGSLTNATVASQHSGSTGSGYVDFTAATGASVQLNGVLTATAGKKNLDIRYALASGTRYLDVYVNGTRALTNVAFPATGSWSTWQTMSVQVQIPQGNANTVRLVTTGTEGPNIDSVRATGWTETSSAKRLRYDSYGAYAQHLEDFVTYMRGQGVDLYAISVQNEPDYAHEWTAWTPAEITRFMREHAGRISTRVIAPESFQYIKSLSDPILDDPQALANMDILGAHLYGTSYANFPYPKFQQQGQGKELWMTEVYYPNSEMTSGNRWPESLEVARHMHHAMTDAQFQAYVWWYIRRGYGPLQEDGSISKRGYAMAHFSKFVRPGAVRIETTATPRQGVYVSAYQNTDGKVAVVVVNQSTTRVAQPVTVRGTSTSRVTSYTTDAGRNLAQQTGIGLSNGTFTATLPAQSVTTFVVDR
ncbi:carbohydrate-binding protein [Cellulomonas phragmiteti]|uniref:CBM6 domain-containing protein n=1 Tax=Cellulomonas phragmiteti TaxID=478780 RepID=A0ABQ4DHD8_9CELL|nr:carbohydrate-binding protein [Cellulomonas phragmiteti]GIG38762.1 hypothetical protein Cph01nite_05240 [Cellulomonas phragmiteti]